MTSMGNGRGRSQLRMYEEGSDARVLRNQRRMETKMKVGGRPVKRPGKFLCSALLVGVLCASAAPVSRSMAGTQNPA